MRFERLSMKPISESIFPDRPENWRTWPVNIQAPEAQEPLVDVKDYGLRTSPFYCRAQAPYYRAFSSPRAVYVREGVAKTLGKINAVLKGEGLGLLAWDGWRSFETQAELRTWFEDRAKEHLGKNASQQQIMAEADQYCSAVDFALLPNAFEGVPVHSTGGSIDVTLINLDDDQQLFMGSIFDDPSKITHTRYFEQQQEIRRLTASETEALYNRRILCHVMTEHGFQNDTWAAEWFHYCLGTQRWACHPGRVAYYNRTHLPNWPSASASSS